MKRTITVIILSVFIIAGLLYLGRPGQQPEPIPSAASSNIFINSTANTSSSQESSEINTLTSSIDVFTVKEYNGKIGIFFNEDPVPYQELNVDVSMLPDDAKKLLKDGIRAHSKAELNSIIENYDS